MADIDLKIPTQNLVDAVQSEIRRVRDDVMPAYLEIGAAGQPAAAMMRASMDAATRALAEQDVTALVTALDDLRGYEL